ncbi:MAG: hypothetical protein DVB31_05390 [Verrucomicrobia bacterium]|nr:MAG: hypothetical protein DVB31_05390 [Verrucomicrobiota bacterium]
MKPPLLKTDWQKVTLTMPADLVAQIDACLRVVGISRNAWMKRAIVFSTLKLAAEADETRSSLMDGKTLHSPGNDGRFKTLGWQTKKRNRRA